MKITRFEIAFIAGMAFLFAVIGCTTTQQTAAYNTLSGLETGTTAAYNAYLTLVAQGTVSTNSVPQVSHDFNDFQSAMVLAVLAAQNNTNALAPTNLVAEAAAVVSLINTVEQSK